MKNNAPLFSVLLPTHNRADVLTFAIQSVLSQTVQDFELLIVGDGCTDNTAEVVKNFSDSRIQWFDLPKAPHFGYANRNIALKSARGSLIAFMAHDDLWLSDHLEILLKPFEDETIEIAYSRPLWVIPQGIIVPGTFNLNFYPTLEKFLNKERNEIPASCFVHRKECYVKYGYWDEDLSASADWDMWARIIGGGMKKNFFYVDCPTCLHFKASWRDETYDQVFGFKFWRNLLATENSMIMQLHIPISDFSSEQEAIWNEMSNIENWNKKIRSAIYQVLDFLANKEIFLTNQLRKELNVIKNQLYLIENELSSIKSTTTWQFHEKITNNSFFQYCYRKIKKRLS